MGLAGIAETAQAQNRAAVERQFQAWLSQEIWPRARRSGVSRATFDAAFNGVRLDWELPDLVVPGQQTDNATPQSQAEFRSPARYFAPNGVQGATRTGRQMLQRHAKTLARIEQRTGVPGRILLAVWSRESAYGRAKIPHNAFQVLATKGFLATRKTYFANELIALLQIAQAGHAPLRALRSSWAGALGQPQFMPSSFLKYAQDGDGDRRADIWGSEADTLQSIAAYLRGHGWQKGRDWGFEVVLPQGVSCTLEGPDQGRRFSQWEKMGVTRVGGKAFPKSERRKQGYLLLPAGRHGPAFLVTDNFYVLKDYNFSDLYALYVGHLGDRIQYGMGDFVASWGKTDGLLRSDVARAQRSLERIGHDVGGADGLAGFKTRRSIGRWQEAQGQRATCYPSKAIMRALR